MIEVLLQHKSSIRKLRALSLFIALLLAPFSAWGQKSITVAGTTVSASGSITGENISGSVVSINFETNTLTLEDATINGGITWTNTEGEYLTIEMKGKNSVAGNINCTYGAAECSLYIKKISTAESATLIYSGYTNGFDLKPDDGFNYFLLNNATYYYTTLDVYDLEVGSIRVHDIEGEPGYKGNILQDEGTPTVTFDGTNKVTLNGATLTDFIHWNKDADLTVELKGMNSINCTYANISCFEGGNNRSISFIQGDASNPCSLTLTSSYGVIGPGFNYYSNPSMGAGLYWYPTTENGKITSATVKTILSGGEGTEEFPYLIKTYDDLKNFATYVNDGILCGTGTHIRLDADIDCTGKTDFVPIGYNNLHCFWGHFDGNGKTISNLVMTDVDKEYVGLFGYNDGEIKNLTLSGCTISGGNGDTNYIGAIVGDNRGTISGCTVKNSNVSCKANSQYPIVGGIAGYTADVITNCVVENTNVNAVTSDDSDISAVAGGIAGLFNGTVSGCEVKGTTTVTADYSNGSTDVYAGAIMGRGGGGSGNTYESTVVTKTKKKGDTDYTVKSGQTQRGRGNKDDEIGQVELAGTKKVKVLVPDQIGYNSSKVVEGTYYLFKDDFYYSLPGYDFTFSATPEPGYKPRLTLSDESVEPKAVERKKENGAYDHTEFTFKMPSADLTATLSLPIDLAAISADDFSIDDANYTGSAIEPTTVKVEEVPGASGVTVLTKDTHFTITGYKQGDVSVTSPVEKGTYTVTIEGKGDYIGTKDVSFSIVEGYDLWIDGKQFNDLHAEDFYKNGGRIRFTPASDTNPANILTLDNAIIKGVVKSKLDNLTIHLTGGNKIKPDDGNEVTYLIQNIRPEETTLTFETDAAPAGVGSLILYNSTGNFPINGFEVTYGARLDYDEETMTIGLTDYHLRVGGREVTSDNKTNVFGDGKVIYDREYRKLILNDGTTLDGDINWSGEGDLFIALNGTISVTGGTDAIYTNDDKIIFEKAEGATSAELTATCGSGYTPIEYNSIILDNGLYWKPVSSNSTIITDDPEFIIFNDYAMTDEQVIGDENNGIKYNATDNTLTFKEANESITSPFTTGITGLTVKLIGTSPISATSLDYLFKALTNTASIKFVGEDGGRLDMATKGSSAPFEGFADGKVTYDKLVYWYDNTNQVHTIQAPTAPTMELDANEKATLSKPYADGDIYYTIAYANGKTPEVKKTKYEDAFALEAPGTVEAWAEANNATTSTVKGKHFGYQDAPFTLTVGESKDVVMIPSIEEGDGIAIVESPSTSNEEIAACSEGVITAKKFGNAILTAMLQSTSGVVILNEDNVVSAIIKVGEAPQISFSSGSLYATYCNQSDVDLTVPEGLTAYAITGTTDNSVTLEEVKFLPKYEPTVTTAYIALLLKRADTSKDEIGPSFIYDGNETRPGTNLLKFASSGVATAGKELFVLYKDEFVKATGTIPQYKCYLEIPAAMAQNNSRSFSIGDGGTTGIVSMDNGKLIMDNEADAQWHDLQGRKIQKPSKAGLYIINGKKVVIR